MRFLFIILALSAFVSQGQDKLFFGNGTVKKGIIVSVTKNAVYFKDSDTSSIQKINKSDLLMSENRRGLRFIFYKQDSVRTDSIPKKIRFRNNSLGIQPLGILVGRGTIVYERYTQDHKIGFVFPLSLTFDPFGSLYNSRIDTNRNTARRTPGINFIGGIDVNFYLGKSERSKFFIGPRFRYGTDMLLRGIEAYSLQTQVGWRIGSPEDLVTQHLSIGFGFANIISSFRGPILHPKQFYGWYSINYRIGLGW